MQDILEYIHQSSTAAVRDRGARIYENRRKLQFIDFANNQLQMKVKGSESEIWYDVQITALDQSFEGTCSCPHDWGGLCKHQVAAMLYFQDYLERMPAFLRQQLMTGSEKHDQQDVSVKLPDFQENAVLQFIAKHQYQEAKSIARKELCKIKNEENSMRCELNYGAEDFHIVLEKQGDELHTACSCAQKTATPLCVHKVGALLQILYKEGAFAFEELKDWTGHKEQLLASYGYSLEDPQSASLFEFYFEKGVIQVKPKDAALLKIDKEAMAAQFEFLRPRMPKTHQSKHFFSSLRESSEDWGIGYALTHKESDALIPLKITAFRGKLHRSNQSFSSHITPIDQLDLSVMRFLDNADRQVLGLLQELSDEGVHQVLVAEGLASVGNQWEKRSRKHYSEQALEMLDTYLLGVYHQVFQLLESKMVFSIDEGDGLRSTALMPISLAEKHLMPVFLLEENEEEMVLHLTLQSGNEVLHEARHSPISVAGIMHGEAFYRIHDVQDVPAIKMAHDHPIIRIRKAGKEHFIRQVLIPLMQRYPVEINADLPLQEIDGIEPEAKLFLDEREGFLMLTPLFEYDGRQVSPLHPHDIVYEEEGDIFCVKRDYDYEEEMLTFLSQTHEFFIQEEESFFLHANQVLENNWFFEVFALLKEKGFEVLGFDLLKSFRYSPYKPETVFEVKSGIDWFDCEITVKFGDQQVSLKDVRKALLNKNNYVKLGDGTLGVLPEEWIARYGTILKLGQVNKDELKLSKVHFSVVDELYEEISNKEVLAEINYKKEKLKSFDKIQHVKPSENIVATLRDYQKSGLNWLHFLHEFRWGGCLADDMGLGKTLQTLAFFQGLKDTNEKFSALVVAPTSLIFNWAKEIEKFTPKLRYLIHHGTQRTDSLRTFYDYDIILTTYGIVVRDVEKMRHIKFDYIALDESQAIKNVTSKRYKAVSLLQGRNRMVLTGTPVENNTFELYAQMNFLNPGILGSQEFFKMEYANPIDKKGDRQRVEELKKIVYPFILRRSKEQVAQDLPDKSETIMYCEMGVKQRKVYDATKNYYRDKLMNLIEEQGLERSGIHVLEGLLKLRQICDSPALLKDKNNKTVESVKLNELGHQVQEVVGSHKVLIFSQFVEMLSLIKEQMERKGIPYCYLDGQTRNREAVVDDFQENPKKRVFLISLKAGGVGLNLTAADYVYLVDPWWNPAVEQQAIDRTHRIGQTQKVFAYKMICKDSIEEKMLVLQQKKRDLVTDIISPEKGFLKHLTKEDIADLFS